MNAQVCEQCGEPAPVSVLAGYSQGKPITRHFCLSCADQQRAVFDRTGQRPRETRLSTSTLCMLLGLLIGGTVITVDVLGVGGNSGFGWHQQAGLVVGALMVVSGAMLRIDIIGLGGALLLIVAAFGDYLGLSHDGRESWMHTILVTSAAVLTACGLILRRRRVKEQQE